LDSIFLKKIIYDFSIFIISNVILTAVIEAFNKIDTDGSIVVMIFCEQQLFNVRILMKYDQKVQGYNKMSVKF